MQIHLTFNLLLLASSFTLTRAAICPDGMVYEEIIDRCLSYQNTPATFIGAEMICQSMGGHLMSIHNSFENAIIAGKQTMNLGSDTYFWIGATQLVNNQWSWIDKQTFNFSNWAQGEPIDGRQCGAMITNTGQWLSRPCNDLQQFVCSTSTLPSTPTTISPTTAKSCPICPTLAPSTPCPTTIKPVPCTTPKPVTCPPPTVCPTTPQPVSCTRPQPTTCPPPIVCPTTHRPTTCPTCPAPVVCPTPKPQPSCPAPVVCPTCQTCPACHNYCPSGWTWFDQTNSCYKAFFLQTSQAAEQYCVQNGAHLTSIHSDAENSFVGWLARSGRSQPSLDLATWIGLYKSDKTFKNYDGTPVDYLAWAKTEPDNLFGIENCVQMFADTSVHPGEVRNLWNDYPCNKVMRNFVCKKAYYR